MKSKLKYIVLSFIVSLIIIFGVILLYANKNVIGYTVYYVDYSIGDYTGVNLDADAVHFGTIVPGAIAARNLIVTTNKDAMIDIYFRNIEDIEIDQNSFFLGEGESREVLLSLNTPSNAEKGYYSGKLVIIYRNPK